MSAARIAADTQFKREQLKIEFDLKVQQMNAEFALRREQMAAEMALKREQMQLDAQARQAAMRMRKPTRTWPMRARLRRAGSTACAWEERSGDDELKRFPFARTQDGSHSSPSLPGYRQSLLRKTHLTKRLDSRVSLWVTPENG